MKKWRAVTALFVAPVALYLFSTKESDGLADTPVPTVVLLRPPTSDEVTTEAMARVRGELKAAGFDVVIIPLSNDDAKRDLETAGRDLKPIAAFALFVRPSVGGTSVAEIWVSDRIKQQTIIQNALLHETDRGRGSEILAVRAVELLKANLADFWTAPAPPTAAPPAAPSSRPVLPPRESEPTKRPSFASGLGMGVGAGVLESFGAMSAAWAPYLLVSYGWPRGFSVRASFVGLGSTATLFAANGAPATAAVEQQFAMFDAVKTWWPESAFVPFVFAGTGGQHIHVAGAGMPPHRAYTTDNWSLLTTIGVGAGIPVVSTLSFIVQARGVASWPSSVVQIDQANVGRVGTPSLLVDAGFLGVLP